MALATEVNKELLLDFIDESMDSLASIETLFVRLESSPGDTRIVDAIFRPVHSIKGNAAYFGLMRVKELSHRMESLLDLVRQGRRRVDKRLCDLLLKGLDALRSILAKVRDEQKEYDEEDDHAELVVELEEECERSSQTKPATIVPAEFFVQAQAFVASLPEDLRKQAQSLLGQLSPDTAIESAGTGNPAVGRFRKALESKTKGRLPADEEKEVFAAIEELSRSTSTEAHSAIVKEIREIAATFAGSPVGLDPLAREMLLEKTQILVGAPGFASAASTHPPAPARTAENVVPTVPVPGSGPEPATQKKDNANRTMRVAEESIDTFLEQVGELMGIEEMFRYLAKRMAESRSDQEFASDLRQAVEQFGHLSSTLSKSVMELRMTEARPLLQKVPRLSRDVAEKTGKKIEVRVVGEELKIDKSYLELLDAPLMHMVRNACDHGIDPPKARIAAGKPEAGTVCVEIAEYDESVVLSVSDDGRGLNMDGLRRKAIELGLVRPEATFAESDAIAILFRSGVSTAAEITEISGRGVGMDVVKRDIESAGGRIEVSTTQGKGSVFRVVLPRTITTRITDGFLFRCGTERFLLPLRTIVETFPVAAAKVSRIASKGATVFYRDEVIRLIDTARLLGSGECGDGGVFVRINVKGRTCVMRVDEALGVQRTVIKPVDEICQGGGVFAGAAMLGDGSLAMVLGEDGLAAWLRGT